MVRHFENKLRQIGGRPVHRVDDDVLIVTVIAIGKRERSKVSSTARKR